MRVASKSVDKMALSRDFSAIRREKRACQRAQGNGNRERGRPALLAEIINWNYEGEMGRWPVETEQR